MKSTLAFFALAGLAGSAVAQSCNTKVSLTNALQSFPYAPTLVEENPTGLSTTPKETGFANNQLRIAFLTSADVNGRTSIWTTSKGCTSESGGKIAATYNANECYVSLAINRGDLKECFEETTADQNGIVYTYKADLTLKVSDPVTPSDGAPYTRTDSTFYKTSAVIRGTSTDVMANTGEIDVSVTPVFKIVSQKLEIGDKGKKFLRIVVQSDVEWPFNLQMKNDPPNVLLIGQNFIPAGAKEVAVTGSGPISPVNTCTAVVGSACLQSFELSFEVQCGSIDAQTIATAYASCRRSVLSNNNENSCYVGDETSRQLSFKVQSDNTCSNVEVVLSSFQPEMVINNDKTAKTNAALLPMTSWVIHLLTNNAVEAAGLKVSIPNLWITTDITNRKKNEEKIYLIKDRKLTALANRSWNKFECSNATPGNTYCSIFAGLEDPDYWTTAKALTDVTTTGTYGILLAGQKGTYTFHADVEYTAGSTVHLRRRLSARADVETGSASRSVSLDITNYNSQYSHTADSSSSKFPAGAIGGLVGGLVAVGAIVGGGFMYRKKKQQKAVLVPISEVEEIKA